MEFARRHLTFANVISVIALFVALGGGAYAVQIAKKNSVTTKSIRDRTIRSVDVGNGQIGSRQVTDGGLAARDFEAGVLADATTGSTTSSLGVCVQNGTEFQACHSNAVELTGNGKIFATADGSADSGSAAVSVGVNTCRLLVDGAPITGEFVIAADFSPGEAFSFSGVSGPLGQGTHIVTLQCKGNGTAPGPRIFSPSLTTIVLGAG
jgi:hypothetical protein